jgi:hypothetical protein
VAAWTIRNYNFFIRTVRTRYELTDTQARIVYSEMRRDLGRAVFSSDLKRHPSVTKQALNFAERNSFRKKEEDDIEREIEDALDMEQDYSEFEGGIDYA